MMLHWLFAYSNVGFNAVSTIENDAVKAVEENEVLRYGVVQKAASVLATLAHLSMIIRALNMSKC